MFDDQTELNSDQKKALAEAYRVMLMRKFTKVRVFLSDKEDQLRYEITKKQLSSG